MYLYDTQSTLDRVEKIIKRTQKIKNQKQHQNDIHLVTFVCEELAM